MTSITTTHFTNTTTGETATVVVYPSMGVIVTKAYVGTAAAPRWEERASLKGNRRIAEQSAACWAGVYQRRLQNDYHMVRAA